MTVKLKVGYEGQRRDGSKSKIVEVDRGMDYPFRDDTARCYKENGSFLDGGEYRLDIIGPWEEPQTSPIQPASLRPGEYGVILIDSRGKLFMYQTDSQAELTAAIETLSQIRDAEVLK